MLFSTRTEYGLRFLVLLAEQMVLANTTETKQKMHDNQTPVSVSDIAKQEQISKAYLEKLAVYLKDAGIVRSTKGVGGGYMLSRIPREISIKEIINALEGAAAKPFLCPEVNQETVCHLSSACRTKRVWKRIDDSVNSALTNMTLADVIA